MTRSTYVPVLVEMETRLRTIEGYCEAQCAALRDLEQRFTAEQEQRAKLQAHNDELLAHCRTLAEHTMAATRRNEVLAQALDVSFTPRLPVKTSGDGFKIQYLVGGKWRDEKPADVLGETMVYQTRHVSSGACWGS